MVDIYLIIHTIPLSHHFIGMCSYFRLRCQVGNKCDMFDELQVTEDEGRAKAGTSDVIWKNDGSYPLVNIQKTIEHGHWTSGFTH